MTRDKFKMIHSELIQQVQCIKKNNAEHELSSLTIQRNHFIDTEIE